MKRHNFNPLSIAANIFSQHQETGNSLLQRFLNCEGLGDRVEVTAHLMGRGYILSKRDDHEPIGIAYVVPAKGNPVLRFSVTTKDTELAHCFHELSHKRPALDSRTGEFYCLANQSTRPLASFRR